MRPPLPTLLLLLAAPSCPSSEGEDWLILDCRSGPPIPPPAWSTNDASRRTKVLVDGCSTEELRHVTTLLAKQTALGVTDLWLRSLTLSQSSSGHGAGGQGRKAGPASSCFGGHFPRLSTLKISRSAVGPTAAGLATACDSLEQLDLSENPPGSSGQLLTVGLTGGGRHLHLLNLSMSQLSELPEGAFQELAQLRVLDLSHNRLTRLPGGVLARNQRLTHLHLQHNAISALTRHSFQGESTVKKAF
jgi:Leucine-rich repeat (LRR) protein